MKPIKTIGHSNHPIERFVSLLKAGAVERLVDVRSIGRASCRERVSLNV